MEYRQLGRTGVKVSELCLGCMMFGGKTEAKDSYAIIDKAIDGGVNFIDTADVYGDGRSERLIARVLRERPEEVHVATKAGRRLDPHNAAGYNRGNLTAFVEPGVEGGAERGRFLPR